MKILGKFVVVACRWDKGYESCYLDDMPHKVLTRPAQAFEYFFEGIRKGQQRDHLVKLEVTAAGTLNALAIWFDLHLDEEESITTGLIKIWSRKH